MTKSLFKNCANKTMKTRKSSTKQNSAKTFQKLGFAVMEKNVDSPMGRMT